MTEPLIKDVSDTSYWIAYYRAQEGKRADCLFQDPWAERLAGEHGKRIAESMPAADLTAWNVVIRTRIIDELIDSALASGVDTVLNLGAGLDTRPYRMKLPSSLLWIEVDYPKIIDEKEKILRGEKPVCQLERVRLDLSHEEERRRLFSEINSRAKKVLVLSEGVIPYLSAEEVSVLAKDLYSRERFHFWILEFFSAAAMKYRRRAKLGRKMRNAPFRFDPKDWHSFFAGNGWRPLEIRYQMEEGLKLNRPIPLPWRMRLIIRFLSRLAPRKRTEGLRKSMGYALIQRQP